MGAKCYLISLVRIPLVNRPGKLFFIYLLNHLGFLFLEMPIHIFCSLLLDRSSFISQFVEAFAYSIKKNDKALVFCTCCNIFLSVGYLYLTLLWVSPAVQKYVVL